MLARAWLSHPPIGVGLVVVIGLALAGLNNHQHEAASTYQAATHEDEIRPAPPKREADNLKAKRADKRAKRDLRAQEDMAEWAFWMLVATALGVALVGGTLVEAWKAGRAAAAVLKETKRQADIAEETAAATTRQFSAYIGAERPFVFLEITEPGIGMQGDGSMRFAGKRFAFQFTNYGRTPALLHEINESYPIVEGLSDAPPPLDPMVDRGRMQPTGIVSAVGAPHKLRAYLPNVADINRMLEKDAWRERRLFLQGFVRFSDPFGTHYITGFLACFKPSAEGWEIRGGDQYNYTRVEDPADIPPHPSESA